MVVSSDTSKWYVVHCHSGFEKKVADAILEEAKKVELDDFINEVSVPTQEVTEVRRGKRVKKQKKYFPGYVLVKLDMNKEVYHLIKNIQKVSGFLGSEDKPTPITDKEIQRILGTVSESANNQKSGISFEIGEKVKVCDGPFASFNGLVEEIDEEKSRLKVSVSIFGRATPVDLEYHQVEKN
jgi:transcriptional antiterminator NusG